MANENRMVKPFPPAGYSPWGYSKRCGLYGGLSKWCLGGKSSCIKRGGKRPKLCGGGGGWLKGGGCWWGGKGPRKCGGLCWKMHIQFVIYSSASYNSVFYFYWKYWKETLVQHMPACVEEMRAPAGPKEADQAGSPRGAAGQMTQAHPRMGAPDLIHLDHSSGFLL